MVEEHDLGQTLFGQLRNSYFLQKHGYRYILHFTPNAVTKRMNLKDGQNALYPVGDGESSFKIVRADDSETIIKYLCDKHGLQLRASFEEVQTKVGSRDVLQKTQ